MRVRRTAALTGVVTVLVLLGGPAWADETPTPTPTPSEIGLDGSCFFQPAPTDAPTETPTDEVTDEPTVEPTDEVTVEPTDEPTVEPTDEPTVDPTDEPTDEPTGEPTSSAPPDGYYVCAEPATAGSGEGDPTLGSGSLELPFSGASVGRYAAIGFALVLGGGGVVLVARRRIG